MTTLVDTLLDEIVTRALAEDLAGGDVTTDSIVLPEQRALAKAIAHDSLVVAGGEAFSRAFFLVDRGLRVECVRRDAERAAAGDVLFIVEGAARSILLGERTALNFLQRLSGVATTTRRFIDALPAGSATRISDTRKTTPGLRALERLAVRAGGGHNHRNDLGSAVLIKDNHIVAAGGVHAAVERARSHAPHTSRIEVEVESLAELDQALSAGAEVVMLDNFADSLIEQAVTRARGRALVEVSGGITIERIARLAAFGVDVISVGGLTHSAPAVDIGLDLELLG